MAASGKSPGKSPGQPAPGPGKGGGQPERPPYAGYYNAANDFYGPMMQIRQPMAGYYNQFPSPFPTYAPPQYGSNPIMAPYQNLNPYGGAYSTFQGGYNPYTPNYVQQAQDQNYNSPEVQSAYRAGASPEASASELHAFNLGAKDLDGDGRLTTEEFRQWPGYDSWAEQAGGRWGIADSSRPAGVSGGRFTGQYDSAGNPIYSPPAYSHDNYAGQNYGYSPYGGYQGYSPYGYGGYSGFAGLNPFQSSYQPYNAYAGMGMGQGGGGQQLYDLLMSRLFDGGTEEQAGGGQTTTTTTPTGPNYGGAFSTRPSAGGTVATMGNPFAMAASDASTQDLRNVMIDDGAGNVGRINVNFDELSDAQRNALIQIAQDNPDMNQRSRAAYDYMQSEFGFA